MSNSGAESRQQSSEMAGRGDWPPVKRRPWIERNTPHGLGHCVGDPGVLRAVRHYHRACETATSTRNQPSRSSPLVEVLRHFGESSWWLGYLDTGGSDVVFPGARSLKLYASRRYIVVQAGPDQAIRWRNSIPDLIFPTDRASCLSTLWDDTWTCLGGSAQLIRRLEADQLIHLRRVGLQDDATPAGHVAI